MGKLLLDGCYASGVFALDDVYYPLGKAELFLLNGHAVTDNVDRYAGVNISKHVKVKVVVKSLEQIDILIGIYGMIEPWTELDPVSGSIIEK